MPKTKIKIPPITDERIKELLARIKPVITKDGIKRYIKLCHPRNEAYTWDAKPTDEAEGITPIIQIKTYHTFGYHGFFKPSLAEVLAQIPEEHIERCAAFEIVERPKRAEDLNEESEALNQGFHVATTQLYALA
jgi:hypothetical protein